jgi:hypothetical protein
MPDGNTFGPLPNKLVRARLFAYEETIVVAMVTNKSGAINNGSEAAVSGRRTGGGQTVWFLKYAGTRLAPTLCAAGSNAFDAGCRSLIIYKENP